MSAAKKATQQPTLEIERITKYPGQQQVDRAVKVDVPGKHFPQLTPAEQKLDYEGTAVEHGQRHAFGLHRKAWGAAHTGEGIRFVCKSDAIDESTRTTRDIGPRSSYGTAGATIPSRIAATMSPPVPR